MNLFERLRAAGVSEAEATDIVQTHAKPEGDIDVDRLTKAMEGVADSFGDNTSSAVDAAVQEASDIVDAVTKGADALLIEVRDLRATMSSDAAEIQKSLTAVADEPVARRSVTTEVVPAPGEVHIGSPELGYSQIIAKAVAELKATDDRERAIELRKAVSMLESGFSASHVSTQFGIN
jgi:hypothetical protein